MLIYIHHLLAPTLALLNNFFCNHVFHILGSFTSCKYSYKLIRNLSCFFLSEKYRIFFNIIKVVFYIYHLNHFHNPLSPPMGRRSWLESIERHKCMYLRKYISARLKFVLRVFCTLTCSCRWVRYARIVIIYDDIKYIEMILFSHIPVHIYFVCWWWITNIL